MKSLNRVSGLALALGLAVPMMASASNSTITNTLRFSPSDACGPSPCTVGGALSNSYGDMQSLGLDVSYFSDLNSPGTGPVFYFTGISSLTDVAIGGDLTGGGAGNISFVVLPSTGVSTVLTGFDFVSASALPGGFSDPVKTAFLNSYNWWVVYRYGDYSVIESGQFSVGSAVQHISSSGAPWTDPTGLVLQWGNSAGFATYTSVDNVQYSVVSTVPEGDTLGLFAAGLGVVGWAAARRKKLKKV